MRVVRFVFGLAQWLVTAGLVLGLVGVVLFFTVPRLLGWELQVVLGRSMEPALPVGAVTFVQPTAADQVRVGDIVAYWLPTDPDKQATHRVEEVVREGGSLSFRTKGDANEDPDSTLVPAENLVGRVRWHIPWLGYIAERLRTPMGFLGLILLPGGIIILTEAGNIFRQLRGGGQGGGSGGRPREPGEARESRPPLWLAVLGLLALGAALGALRRPERRKARPPPKTVTAAARWRWAWLGCLLVLIVGTAALWAGGSRALLTDRETSYENSMEVATDLNPGPQCEESIAEDDGDAGADDADEQSVSTPDEGVNPAQGVVTNYEIRRGDTLAGIATRFGTTVQTLAKLNNLEDPAAILHGSTLNVPYLGGEPELVLPEEVPEEGNVPPSARWPLPPVPTAQYEVQSGDTLWDIATRFGTTVQTLAELNGLENPATILYGSTLKVPYLGEDPQPNLPEEGPEEGGMPPSTRTLLPLAPTTEYTVQLGDTLWDIARRFGTTIQALVELNSLEDRAAILYGSTLNVPYVAEELGNSTPSLSP